VSAWRPRHVAPRFCESPLSAVLYHNMRSEVRAEAFYAFAATRGLCHRLKETLHMSRMFA
jgi:hypothetical protein